VRATVRMALVAAAHLSAAGCASPPPEESPPSVQLAAGDVMDVHEAAIRQAFKDVIRRNAVSYCVSLEDADPSPRLLLRFKGADPSVVPVSECRDLRGRPKDAKGKPAIEFRVSRLRAITNGLATVVVGWNTGNSIAGDASYEYRVRRGPSGWVLSGRRMLSVA
jgi:hypothetical protein